MDTDFGIKSPKMTSSAVLSFLFCLLVSAVPGLAETSNESIQKYLTEKFDNSNYDKRIFPDGKNGPGTDIEVKVSMHILEIDNMNEHNMDYNAQIYLKQNWVDSRLQYNMPNVDKIILTDVDHIWTPDLYIVNEKEGSLNKITQPNIFCQILPNGSVTYSMRIYEKLRCPMDLSNYPHDTQICRIEIESYGYFRKRVSLAWTHEIFGLASTADVLAIDYDLTDVSQSAFTGEGFSVGNYSVLEAHLTFKRKIGFFTRKMYLPYVFFVFLSWLSFWIRPEDMCLRLTLLLVVLYLMVTTTSELDRWIPFTAYTKASDVWIGFGQAFVFAAFLEFICIGILFKRMPWEDNSSGKIEMSSIMDNEAKDTSLTTDSLRLLLNQISNRADTRSGGIGRAKLSLNYIDRISRFAFPIIFLLFNIVYWSVYGSV